MSPTSAIRRQDGSSHWCAIGSSPKARGASREERPRFPPPDTSRYAGLPRSGRAKRLVGAAPFDVVPDGEAPQGRDREDPVGRGVDDLAAFAAAPVSCHAWHSSVLERWQSVRGHTDAHYADSQRNRGCVDVTAGVVVERSPVGEAPCYGPTTVPASADPQSILNPPRLVNNDLSLSTRISAAIPASHCCCFVISLLATRRLCAANWPQSRTACDTDLSFFALQCFDEALSLRMTSCSSQNSAIPTPTKRAVPY